MRIPPRSSLLRLPAAIGALLLLSTLASAQDATDQIGLPKFHQVSERLFRGGQPRASGIRLIQYWMRDYVEDYGRRLSAPRPEAAVQQQGADEDLGARIGAGVRVAERKVFRARKVGGRVLRRVPGAISGFLGGIF